MILDSFWVIMSGSLSGFSDFLRSLRYGSKICERATELQTEADFLSVLSFVVCRQ